MEPTPSDDFSDSLDRRPRNTVGSVITLAEATAWTGTYQGHHAGQLKAVYFSADVFQALLKQPGATGIRIYNATNADSQDCFVLVGATEDSDLTEGKSAVYDKGQRCPADCVTSPLNHS